VIRLLQWFFVAGLVSLASYSEAGAASLGEFEEHSDVGAPKRAGAAEFDAARRGYKVTGGGKNVWFANDALHFVWKKVSGDVTLAADIAFAGQGGDPHRKACLLVRQSLDDDSAYADAALAWRWADFAPVSRGEGRADARDSVERGGAAAAADRETRHVCVHVHRAGRRGVASGGRIVSARAEEPFYVGLGVCAHNDDALETAVFANVELTEGAPPPGAKPSLISTLETITLSSEGSARRVVDAGI
jgi:hypothetical protein